MLSIFFFSQFIRRQGEVVCGWGSTEPNNITVLAFGFCRLQKIIVIERQGESLQVQYLILVVKVMANSLKMLENFLLVFLRCRCRKLCNVTGKEKALDRELQYLIGD